MHTEQIEQYREQLFTVYRGQRLSTADFTKLRKTVGGLMSFNSFLSTSRDKDVPLIRAISATDDSDMYGILFIITVDPTIHSTVFANIETISYFSIEAEILFSMHSVFRITQMINLEQHDRLFEVHLTLTNDDDRQLRILTNEFEKETGDDSSLHRLTRLVITLHKPNLLAKLYEGFNTGPDDLEKKI